MKFLHTIFQTTWEPPPSLFLLDKKREAFFYLVLLTNILLTALSIHTEEGRFACKLILLKC